MVEQKQLSMFIIEQFSKASEIRKQRIIQDFLHPKFIPRSKHDKAKNCIVNCIQHNYNFSLINDGLKYVNNYPYKKFWEKENSIKSLQNFKTTIPPFKENFVFEKIHKKEVEINGLSIYVNPEVIIKEVRDGITYLGALKINISKSTQDKIDYDFCRTIVFEYLKSIANDGEKVDFKMIYFYTPLNNKWNNSNSMIHTQIIENTIDEFFSYLHKLKAA